MLDESGQEINEDHPLVTEHDGSTGDTITRSLTLVNTSDHYYYKNTQITVNSVFPVTAQVIVSDVSAPRRRTEYFDRGEAFPFTLQLSVKPGTPDQVVRGINICVSGTRFLSSFGDMEN